MGRDITDSDSELSTCSRVDYDSIEPLQLQADKKHSRESNKHACDHVGCNKVFNRPWKLTAHKQLHFNERPFACKEVGCTKAFTNTSHLKRHVRTCHEKTVTKQLIKCTEPGCEALLKTKQFLQRHLKRKHTDLPFKCTDCDAAFKRSRQLKEHVFIHTGIHPFICSTCNRGFEKSYDLKRHERGHRTYTCKLNNCSEILPSMSLYRKHITQFHKPKPVCGVCDKIFTTNSNMIAHLSTHLLSEKWTCTVDECNQTFTQEKYLKQHLEHVHEEVHQYQCLQQGCHKVFRWKNNYINHLKLHSTIKSTEKPKRKRKERKDKCKPKTCIAAELSNVKLSLESHKRLLNKEEFNDKDGNISDVSVISEIIYLPVEEFSTNEESTILPISSL